MQNVTLLGRLGGDPELRFTQSGKAVCNFSLATDNGKDSEPTWHRIVVWDKTAENCAEFLTKGSQVLIESGRIQYRQYENKDGVKMTSSEIIAGRVHFVGGRSKTEDDAVAV